MAPEGASTYKAAGVDLDAADRFEDMIKERVAATWPDTGGEIGGFAGGGPIPPGATHLKGSTDGTGTKAILAALLGKFDGLGQDAVAMSAVDMYVSGNRPTYLLDTLDVGHLDPDLHIAVIESVIRGCQRAGCKLIGGETAELPDLFRHPWMVNVNAHAIGFPAEELKFGTVKSGQAVYGWASHGPGSNGFSLLRKVFKLKDEPARARRRLLREYDELGTLPLHSALLAPTEIWIQEIERQRKAGVRFCGHAHITGSGMPGNIPRILPPDCKVVIDRSRWGRPLIFRLTQEMGHVSEAEMDRVFNQGVQVVSIVSQDSPSVVQDRFAHMIGTVESRTDDEPQVVFTGKHSDGEIF